MSDVQVGCWDQPQLAIEYVESFLYIPMFVYV